MDSFWNKIYLHDSRAMTHIPDNSVNLMVTSPPYNVTKQYDDDLPLQDYLDLISAVLKDVLRVLMPGGIVALNIANVGRKPYIPLDCLFIEILSQLKFVVIQEIIWDKAASAGGSCAWGSWQSASNPSLRDIHEYIIIAQKSPVSLSSIHLTPQKILEFPDKIDEKILNLNEEDFFTNIWSFGTESAKRVNHPAPFRVELPYRIIQMFTEEGDLILDPFMGSGSTALACITSNRKYIGYEINSSYLESADRRIDEFHHPEKKKLRLKQVRALRRAEKKKNGKISKKKKSEK